MDKKFSDYASFLGTVGSVFGAASFLDLGWLWNIIIGLVLIFIYLIWHNKKRFSFVLETVLLLGAFYLIPIFLVYTNPLILDYKFVEVGIAYGLLGFAYFFVLLTTHIRFNKNEWSSRKINLFFVIGLLPVAMDFVNVLYIIQLGSFYTLNQMSQYLAFLDLTNIILSIDRLLIIYFWIVCGFLWVIAISNAEEKPWKSPSNLEKSPIIVKGEKFINIIKQIKDLLDDLAKLFDEQA